MSIIEDKSGVLIVDDGAEQIARYREMLVDLNEQILTTTSASEALNLLSRHDVAVVLIGLGSHGSDGFELADLICSNSHFQKTAILFLYSSPLADTDQIQGYRSGAVDYISVPVNPEVMRAKVRVFVDLHRKTRMLERLNAELEQRVEERTEALRRSEAEFRTRADLLELASEAIIVRGIDGNIQFWNAGAESLYGWTREEVLGKELHSVLQTVFPVSREATERILSETGMWHGDLVHHTRDGHEIVVACRKTLNRELNAVLEVTRDITAQLHAEEVLRESERLAAMGRVAGVIAHEINNPLTAVTNILFLLQNHTTLDEEARRFVDSAEKELARVSQITRQTLSFYREAREPVPVRVEELLEDVVELQKRALQSAHITVSKKYLATGTIMGFPMELRQVFLNLITNAIQAMPDGGTLRLHVHEATDWITGLRGSTISVLDTGAGIRSDDAKRLFEPFFTTKAAKGNGLGLWISKGILQKYNGRITYRSHKLEGRSATCFRVFLPDTAASSVPQPDAAPARAVQPAATEKGGTSAGTSLEPVFAPCT